MGFTKLDEGILQSSIIGEDSDSFKVWIILLASCKANGIAPISAVYVASISKIDIEKVATILNKLEQPDRFSRTLDHEGRRIERVNGGYKILNYAKYRETSYSDSSAALRQKRYRNKKALESVTRYGVTESNGDISASASASEFKKGSEEGKQISLHAVIVKRFCEGYEKSHGIKYMGVRHDVKELSAFLKDNPDMTEELYFKAANLCIDDPFHSKNLTMRYVCKHFNTLLAKANNEE